MASIDKMGLKFPIVVDADMELIDGLRRYEAMQKLGWDRVPVIICATLEESCEAIAKSVKNRQTPVTPLRGWELFLALGEQTKERSTRLRQRRTGMKRTELLDTATRSRVLISEALGYKGEAFIAAATIVYKAFTSNTDPSKKDGLADIRRKLEAGELSLYETRGAIERLGKVDMSGDIVDINQQRNALSSALSQLTGLTKGTTRIGELNPDINQAELKLYIKGFEDGRRDLQRFINSLKKRVTE